MAWGFEHAALVTARETAAQDAQEYGGNTAYQRLGRAHLWLDEDAQARRSFREAAESMRTRVIETGRATHGSVWATYGHLLRMAGDEAAARSAYERARGMLDDGRAAAEVRYLLGEPPGDAAGLFPETLRALASRDPDAIERAREAVVRAIRAERVLPDYTAGDLTLYDLLEATFGDGVPDHRTMLARAGLLSGGAPEPAVEPPPVGRWTVADASLEQGEEGPIVARLGDGLCLELIEAFGEYEVRLYRGASELNVTGMHPTFGEAIDAATDALRAHAGDWAVGRLTELLAQYGQPH